MTTDEKVTFFLELVNCSYPLYRWQFDASLSFRSTDWQKALFSGDFFSYIGFRELISKHLADGNRTPILLEAESNLVWFAGFSFEGTALSGCHLIGPALTGRDTPMLIRKKLDSFELTAKLRSTIFKTLDEIPVVPTNILRQYAVMLHYCLNKEKCSLYDIAFLNTVPLPDTKTAREEHPGHGGIWINEQRLLKLFAQGDPGYREALLKCYSLSDGVHSDTGDALRDRKNTCIVLLTLCSRACIDGGLPPAIAYDLNDYYVQKIEESGSLTALAGVCDNMLDDYVSRVQEIHSHSAVSGLILSSCEYIRTHITEPLTIADLAKRTGYSEYYFSHKFKKETGSSVSDFILKEKIEQAKLMLAGTNDTIQSISDSLSFGNRSYFYTCFQKHTGLSPSAYRRQNGKL